MAKKCRGGAQKLKSELAEMARRFGAVPDKDQEEDDDDYQGLRENKAEASRSSKSSSALTGSSRSSTRQQDGRRGKRRNCQKDDEDGRSRPSDSQRPAGEQARQGSAVNQVELKIGASKEPDHTK